MERNTVTHIPHPPGNTIRKCHLPTCIQDEGNDTLLDIQAQHIGVIIGTVCCAAPTYADDVALIASTESGEVSTLLNTIETHANMDCLTINSSKSVVLQCSAGRKTPSVDLQINGCVLDSGHTSRGYPGNSSHLQHTTNRHQNNVCAVWCRTVWQKWFQPHGVGQDMDHLHPSTVRSSGASTTQTQTFWRSSSGID